MNIDRKIQGLTYQSYSQIAAILDFIWLDARNTKDVKPPHLVAMRKWLVSINNSRLKRDVPYIQRVNLNRAEKDLKNLFSRLSAISSKPVRAPVEEDNDEQSPTPPNATSS